MAGIASNWASASPSLIAMGRVPSGRRLGLRSAGPARARPGVGVAPLVGRAARAGTAGRAADERVGLAGWAAPADGRAADAVAARIAGGADTVGAAAGRGRPGARKRAGDRPERADWRARQRLALAELGPARDELAGGHAVDRDLSALEADPHVAAAVAATSPAPLPRRGVLRPQRKGHGRGGEPGQQPTPGRWLQSAAHQFVKPPTVHRNPPVVAVRPRVCAFGS